ncbi:Mito_carr domain-containing protein [Cephalotus follicularis]|uniref:Mito_carr domain-containing protein n=1 Tax=Cephalotus follicularis TaxID=3775 RepID=A0A1Q3ASM5_CEPFO|nr:Mito_carr domain-containing protein [Cephalotus follicularis]
MATEATTTKFRSPDFRPVPQQPDYHPEITVTAPHDGLHFWQYMIAGSIAGSVEHMAMFPVDTVKTRMQALTFCPMKSVGVGHAVKSMLQSEGPTAFYRGIAAMGLGAGPAHAVYFSVYETSKKFFSKGNPNNPVAHAISGVFATVSSDAVLTPMDMVKQRLQLGDGTYKGVWDCVKRVLREEGFRAFYASYKTTVVMNAPFTAVHFATYEATKRALMEISPETASDERLIVHATAGAAAGALAAAVTTPLDVVKTQLQCQGVCGCDRFKSTSIKYVIRKIVKKDGYKGLMRGWIPRMLFHAPAAAICWSTYEASKSFFQKINDRTHGSTVT